MSGSFIYQNRLGSRCLSIVILAISLLVTICIRVSTENPILSVVAFLGSLFILSACTIPLNRKLFFKEGSYRFSEDGEQVTIQLGETYTFRKSQVQGVGCDPVEDRKSRSTKVYKITILPKTEEGAKARNFEIFSDNVMVDNRESEEAVKPFLEFGTLLKRWKYN
jgi:hypothetical protein